MLNLKVLVAAIAALISVGSVVEKHASAAQKEIVKFRLVSWKAAHFDDANSAKKTHDALKKLGCEAKQEQHSGHIDVTYRCPQWRSVALKSHAAAHHWERC